MAARDSAPAVESRGRSHLVMWALAVGFLGFIVSAWGIGRPRVWDDEYMTALLSVRELDELVSTVLHRLDAVHALYYAGMHSWLGVAGVSEFTLRLPSALAVGVAAGLIVWLGAELTSLKYGVIAGAVFVAIPRTTWAATEARSFAIAVVCIVMMVLAAVLATRRGWRWWIAYGLSLAVGMGLFLHVALVVPSVIAFLIAARPGRRAWRDFCISTVAALVVVAPLLVIAKGQSGQVSWLTFYAQDPWFRVITDQWFVMTSNDMRRIWWVLVTIGAVLLIAAAVRLPEARSRAALILTWCALPTLLAVATVASTTPLYAPRYMVVSLPALALAIAAVIDALRRTSAIALGIAVLIIALPGYLGAREPDAKSPLLETSAQLENFSSKGPRLFQAIQLPGGTALLVDEFGAGDVLIAVPGSAATPGFGGPTLTVFPESAIGRISAARASQADDGVGWHEMLEAERAYDVIVSSDAVWVATATGADAEELEQLLSAAGFVPELKLSSQEGTLERFSKR